MEFPFNNKKKQKAAGSNEAQERIAERIVRSCIRWQTKWAAWMQRKAECLSDKGKVRVLLLFCLLAGGYSSYLAIGSFSGNQAVPFPVSFLKQPGHIQQFGDESPRASPIISKEEYQRVRQFRQYLDSFAQTAVGKNLHDSMLASRPGFMDSVIHLENLYRSQIKK
jgi:hypothetical protein